MEGFANWDDVLAYAAKHGRIGYQAPLSYHQANPTVTVKGKRLRVHAKKWSGGANDDFTADSGHLDRMRKLPKDWEKVGASF